MYLCEALIPLNPEFSQLISYCALGFLIVMSVLFIQSLLAGIVGKIFIATDKLKKNR